MRRGSAEPNLALLRTVPSLKGKSDRDLAPLAPLLDVAHVEPGDVLTRQGAFGREAFVIVEGHADVERSGRVIATLGAGEFAGEMAMLDQRPRTATVTARTAMALLVVSKRDFASFIKGPGVGEGVAAGLASRLRDWQERPASASATAV